MHFYRLLCFRACSKPWHHWILLQSLTDIHICQTLSASQGQTKTHFEAWRRQALDLAKSRLQSNSSWPSIEFPGEKGTHTLYNPSRLRPQPYPGSSSQTITCLHKLLSAFEELESCDSSA